MNNKETALIKTIAILLSVTPERQLGKLLNLCLVAKVNPGGYDGLSALEMAQRSINDDYSDIKNWLDVMVFADGVLSEEEEEALRECWQTPGMFSDFLLDELNHISWTEMSGQLDDVKQALITAIAILLSVNLETSLGKLFNVCLVTKISQETGQKNPFETATEITYAKDAGMDGIYHWLYEIVQADGHISEEEDKALYQCLKSSDGFFNFVDQELAAINI